MVEVRTGLQRPSPYESHVVVEPRPGGALRVRGIVYRDDNTPKFFTPPDFPSLEIAVSEAERWARRNIVAIVHVVREPTGR